MNGKVKFYNVKKRFGFIAGEDEKDYFVHLTGVEQGNFLKEEADVTFEVEDSEKGPKAVNVKVVNQEPREEQAE